VDEASRRHFTACKESAVDEACKRHFTACKEHVQEIDLLFKSLASRSAQTPEDTAVDEAEERRQQLEEQRRALFQERQKARDPYRRVENRLSDARNYPLEDIGAGVAAGAGGSQKGSTGNLGSVPMTVVDIASASGNTQCPVVDVKKLQSLSKTLGKGMTVKDMVAMAPSPEVTIHSRKRLPKLASVPTTPQERKDALIEHVNRVRCQRQVCHMGRSLTRLNRMRGPTSDDALKDFSSITSSTFEAALRGGVASEFIRVWLDELGVVEELDTLRASQRMRKPARHLRLFRGVMRTVIIFMAHARRAAAANTIIVNLLKKHAMVFKTKLAFQRAAEFRARMAIFGRNFKSRREERLEEMLRQWQEIEDAFLQQNVPDEGELEEGLIRNSKAETSEDDEDMSQAANEDSEDAESAKAREDTADSEPRRSDWQELRIPEGQRAFVLNQYYNARLRQSSVLEALSKAAIASKNVKFAVKEKKTAPRRSVLFPPGKTFWRLTEGEVIELVAQCARALRSEPGFEHHPANNLSAETLGAFDAERIARSVSRRGTALRTMLFTSLPLLIESKPPRRVSAGRRATNAISGSLSDAHEGLDFDPAQDEESSDSDGLGEPKDLTDVLRRFTPRRCLSRFAEEQSGGGRRSSISSVCSSPATGQLF